MLKGNIRKREKSKNVTKRRKNKVYTVMIRERTQDAATDIEFLFNGD